MHGLLGAGGCASCAVAENIVDERGIVFKLHPAFLDRLEGGDDGVGDPGFAFDAADAGGCAAFIDFRQDFRRREDFVKVICRGCRGLCGGCGPDQ